MCPYNTISLLNHRHRPCQVSIFTISARKQFSGQAGFEVVVGEAALEFVSVGVRVIEDDVGQVDAVEHGVFDHGIVCHVTENKFVADVQRRVE
jgi:hypothetical protein